MRTPSTEKEAEHAGENQKFSKLSGLVHLPCTEAQALQKRRRIHVSYEEEDTCVI
jgi:pyrrolidone-carboxylate peptidase